MSSVVSFGTNTNGQRKRVYFTGSTEIFEGMPVCYDDSTTNVLGIDRYDKSASTTTTEGYLNEGRFLRVERPGSDNVDRFAGVVAAGSHVGKTGPRWIDIFIPNGATVPVRTDVSCTKDVTILTIASGEEELGTAGSGTRPVAIARETLDSTSNRLILAELNPFKFIYANSRGTSLDCGAGTASRVMNSIRVTSAQTTGAFSALEVRSTVSAGGYANSTSGGGIIAYLRGEVSATPASHVCGVHLQLYVSAGTISSGLYLSAFHAKLAVAAGATMTDAGRVHPLRLETLCAVDCTGGYYSWMFLENNSTYPPNYLFDVGSAGDLPMTTCSDTTQTHKIPINVGGVTYYIMVNSSA